MTTNKNKHSHQVDFERITFFYANFGIGLLGMMLAVALLGVAIHQLYSPTVALVWALSVVIAYIPRVLVSVTFSRKLKRKEITPGNVRPWERYGILSSIAPFACFAAAVFLPYGENTETALLFCTIYTLMVIAGGTLAYSTSTGVLLLFMNFTLVSLIGRCLWEGGALLTSLAVSLILAHVLLTRLLSRLNRTMVENVSMKLDSAHDSFVDPLTRLWNRRRLRLFVDMLIPASRRSGQPFCIILMDLDHFKKYNDERGHQAGDELLITVSRIIQSCAREQDLVVRYGGEEFLVVLPNTALDDARGVADRILNTVRGMTRVTISAGLDEFAEGADIDSMIRRADEALYAAKQAGRDRLKIACDLPAGAPVAATH